MPTIKLTSKRQATLPKALCDELNVGPGDSLIAERSSIDGKDVWVLRPANQELPDWIGSLQKYAADKSHDMTSIRRSIEQAQRDAG